MITGTMNVPMTLEKANYLNGLEARDRMMAVVEKKIELKSGESKWYECPICGRAVYKGEKFCKECGQRLDMENVAL